MPIPIPACSEGLIVLPSEVGRGARSALDEGLASVGVDAPSSAGAAVVSAIEDGVTHKVIEVVTVDGGKDGKGN